MKIFGHDWIESERFYKVATIEEFRETPANSLLELNILSQNIELVKHCQKEKLRYAVHVQSIKEALFANSLNANYILCEKSLAIALMPIAQNYLFDTQVIALAKESEIEELAKAGVDGVQLT